MAQVFQTGPYEAMFYFAMKEGPAYGYELSKRFEKMTHGHVKVSFGTIYPFLRRMERMGIIKSTRDAKSGRVYYALTAKGRTAQEKALKHVNESQMEWEQKLLGILAIYSEMFGRKALNELLKLGRLLAKDSSGHK